MTTPAEYAGRVVTILRGYFPSIDSVAAEVIMAAVADNQGDPQASFECIVDDPISANWRLKAWSEDRRQVRLGCFRLREWPGDRQFVDDVNDALSEISTETKEQHR